MYQTACFVRGLEPSNLIHTTFTRETGVYQVRHDTG